MAGRQPAAADANVACPPAHDLSHHQPSVLHPGISAALPPLLIRWNWRRGCISQCLMKKHFGSGHLLPSDWGFVFNFESLEVEKGCYESMGLRWFETLKLSYPAMNLAHCSYLGSFLFLAGGCDWITMEPFARTCGSIQGLHWTYSFSPRVCSLR